MNQSLCFHCGTPISGRPVNRRHWQNADVFDWRRFCSEACAEIWFQGVLIESAKLDAFCIKFECLGGQIRDLIVPALLVPLYHAPRVPTYAGAVTLAAAKQIRVESVSAVHRKVRLKSDCYFSIVDQCEVLLRVTGTPVQSAAMSRDSDFPEAVATGLAFRNAVQRVLFPGRQTGTSEFGRDIE